MKCTIQTEHIYKHIVKISNTKSIKKKKEEKRERRNKTISNWQRLTHALRGLPTGHNISQGDGNSSDGGDSIDARNPSSTGMGCYKNYEHQSAQRNRDRLTPQVCAILLFILIGPLAGPICSFI